MQSAPSFFMEELDQTQNIRSIIGLDDTELIASLQKSGWIPQFPAFADENGILIVGHRRMKIAAQLGIAPVVQTIEFGNGSEGDAKKLELAIASNIGRAPLSPEDRVKIAAVAEQRGYTQTQISKILGVSQATISGDLSKSNLSTTDKLKPAKTATNPKGAGRPRGAKVKTEEDIKPSLKAQIVEIMKDGQWRTIEEIESLIGGGRHDTGRLLRFLKESHVVEIRSEGAEQEYRVLDRQSYNGVEPKPDVRQPVISREMLSLTAQQKFDLAVKQEKHRLGIQFQDLVQKEVNRRMKLLLETLTPKLKAEQEEAQRIIKARRGIMTKKAYNKIWSCLHPDRAMQPQRNTDEELRQVYEGAFDIFSKLKRLVLNEEHCPTPVDDKSAPLPKTMAEWEEAERKATAERKAKYAASRANKNKSVSPI